jgi:hypothetical protein
MHVNRDWDSSSFFAAALLRLRFASSSRRLACLAAAALPVRLANPKATAICRATAPPDRILTIRRVLRLIFQPAMLAHSPSKPSGSNMTSAKCRKFAATLPAWMPFPARAHRF